MASKKMKEFKARMRENQDKMNIMMSCPTNNDDDFKRCRNFFDQLATLLKDRFTVVASCNKDLSAYLVPKGTEDQITYYGKPAFSFRVSDHWNWYSNKSKCEDLSIVQCMSVDVEYPQRRDPRNPDKATQPKHAIQVAFYGPDKKYHHVYGDKWNPQRHRYEWKTRTPEATAEYVINMMTEV